MSARKPDARQNDCRPNAHPRDARKPRKNAAGVVLMLAASACACTGQLCWKLFSIASAASAAPAAAETTVASTVAAPAASAAAVASTVTPAAIAYLVTGLALYAAGAILMLLAYRHGSLSVLQPLLSANYALSIILGHAVLAEPLTPAKIAGAALVTLGVIILGGAR